MYIFWNDKENNCLENQLDWFYQMSSVMKELMILLAKNESPQAGEKSI